MKKINLKYFLKDYFIIILGTLFLAVGLNQFLVPIKLSSGGVSTIGTILLHLFRVPIWATNLVVNMILFFFGYKYLGKSALFKTGFGIISLSLFLAISSKFPSYSDDTIIATVLGGVLVGFGVGLVVKKGASTGGSDFASLIAHHLVPHIPIAVLIMIIDFSIVLISGIVFKSVTVTVYSIISIYISAKITDLVVVSGDNAKFAFIISKEPERIADEIMDNFERGVTGIHCRGMYSSKENTMLLCVVSPKEMPNLIATVKKWDKNAFIIVSDAREVLGEGFKEEKY